MYLYTKDTGYIVTGTYAITEGTSHETTRGRILKLDKNLNIKWDKLYDKETERASISVLIELNSSDLITTGAIENSQGNYIATLHKLTKNGNIIWRRQYKAMNSNSSNAILQDIVQTKDNGFAIGGWAYDLPTTPSQQMWAVKTDSLGCDGAGSCSDTTMYGKCRNITICFIWEHNFCQ